MRNSLSTSLLAMVGILFAHALLGYDMVFDFSDPSQNVKWSITSQVLEPPRLTRSFGLFGGYSLRFASPAWKSDFPGWPSCEAAPDLRDWSQYDRLVLEVTNPRQFHQALFFYVSDSKIPYEQGFRGSCQLKGNTHERFVFDLKRCPKTLDRHDISVMRIRTDKPTSDMEIHIGAIYLLKPSEALPAYPQRFVAQWRKMKLVSLEDTSRLLNETMKRWEHGLSRMEMKHFGQLTEGYRPLFKRYGELMSKPTLTMGELEEQLTLRARIENRCRLINADMSFVNDAVKSGQDVSRMAVGIASSMTKAMPRELAFDLEVASSLNLSLARNEYESKQIVVKALSEDLKNVEVTVSPLQHAGGETLSSLDIDVVGFVKTLKTPKYAVGHVGWWPDPLLRYKRVGKPQKLSHCGAVSVKRGDCQAFWLRAHAGRAQKPGIYRGTMTVSADHVKALRFPVSVLVYPFAVPVHRSLPTAISLYPTSKQMTVSSTHSVMKFVYADFLADYQIDYDNLYRQTPPDWEVIAHLKELGSLTSFNLGNIFNTGVSAAKFEAEMQKAIARLRPRYEKAKELKVLEQAYIYGFDECGEWSIVERCSKALQQAFPEVLFLTTKFDPSYGEGAEDRRTPAWCPLTPYYDLNRAQKARKQGTRVWWYNCCTPMNPYANWFVEYHAMEGRLLMGAQAVKYRPDGYLYYLINNWKNNKGINCEKGAYTNWNPVSIPENHGDGSLFYCDHEGYPLPSIRLENYRDGQEDYAYACILEEAIKQVKSKRIQTLADKAWLKEAEEAVRVPETLVRSMSEFSHDPKVLSRWRNRMAEAIVRSGQTDLNPWKGGQGVRGQNK